MPNYTCQVCNYSSKIKCNYLAHLKTKKHLKNTKESMVKKKVNHISAIPIPINNTDTCHEVNKIKRNMKKTIDVNEQTARIIEDLKTLHQYNPKKLIQKIENSYPALKHDLFKMSECEYCGRTFSRPDNLRRHQEYRCLDKKRLMEESIFKDLYEKELKEKQLVKEDHRKQLEMVLEKVGTTTINNHNCNNTQNNTQNNVQLNNFGQENLDMLTDKYMRKMIIYPYSAIPKMIKKIHFNDQFPENQNIRILNKKDNKLQIRNNNKWEYVNKKEALESLINDKNYQLDKYFEENRDSFEIKYQSRFDDFQDKIDDNDKCVFKDINTGTELVFWNSM